MKFLIIIQLFLSANLFSQYTRKAKTLYLDGTSTNKRWVDVYKDHEQNVMYLIEVLERSQVGKTLLERAQTKAAKYGLELHKIIFADIGSVTDTTLTRRFSENRPDKVKYMVRSKILLNRELSVTAAVLDLAHELTHFIEREAFNPYSTKFTIDSFIASTIEGHGGEVEAYISECRVLYELFPNYNEVRSKCDYIKNDDGTYSKKRGAKLFYQVGSFYTEMKEVLSYFNIPIRQFSLVTKDRPSFISSAYGEPYPYAALKEYVNVMRKACANDERRVSLFRERASRSPASRGIFSQKNFKRLQKSYFKRCSSPGLLKANDALY